MRIQFTRGRPATWPSSPTTFAARNPIAAQRVRSAILASLETVRSFPKSGRAQTAPGVRKLVTRKYRYLVYYSVDDRREEVVVLTIQHPARERAFEDA